MYYSLLHEEILTCSRFRIKLCTYIRFVTELDLAETKISQNNFENSNVNRGRLLSSIIKSQWNILDKNNE